MAVMAATDFDRTNATTNYMYRQFNVTFPAQVNSNADADKMDRLRINYYGATAVAGSDICFTSARGFCFWGAYAGGQCQPGGYERDIPMNNGSKPILRNRGLRLQLSTGHPANVDGKGRARMVIADAVKSGAEKRHNHAGRHP